MARISHQQESNKSSNPTTKYLEWKSNDKSFSYYDKSKGENVKVELPFKFVFLQHYHTVKGWSDASGSGIYSNEVYFIGSEPMAVKSFKGGVIAEGLYKEIKPTITNAGGKYHRSVYVMLEDGSLANISFKGAVVREWSIFMENNANNCDVKWVEVNTAVEQKKGSVKYTTPDFTLGASITKADSVKADKVAGEFQEYISSYLKKKDEVVESEPVEIDF
jgi:hypothetical protein